MLIPNITRSGNLASGQVGWPHHASGSVRSGHLATTGTPSTSVFLRGDFAWASPTASVGSGSVGSGSIQSGAVEGFFGARHIASGTVGVSDFGSGAVVAGTVGSGAVRSGNIGSGQIGSFHLADASVLSGDIAADIISNVHLVSGAVTSGRLAVGGTPTGSLFLRDDFTWQSAGGGLTSGAVQSGHVASGAVQGFFGTVRNVASGTVGVFDFGSGAVVAGTVGSGAVVSGNIASGQVGFGHLANASVQSGTIASGIIGSVHLADSSVLSGDIAANIISNVHLVSGAVTSGRLAVGGTPTGSLFLRDDFTWQSAGGGLTSGAVQSGHIASGAVQGFFGTVRNIASGTVGVSDLGSGAVVAGAVGSGAVVSGNIASGQVGFGHLADASVWSGKIASGQVGSFHLADQSVGSGDIVANIISNVHLASGAVTSGRLAVGGTPDGTLFLRDDFTWQAAGAAVGSGSIGSGKVASGAVMGYYGTTRHIASGTVGVYDFGSGNISQHGGLYQSGLFRTILAQESISGVRAIAITPEGNARIAMASVSGRMPAIGVAFDDVTSGVQINVLTFGEQTFRASGTFDFSGYVGQLIYVGRSGQIVTQSGSFNSGGLLSGDITQPVGFVRNSGTMAMSMAASFPFVIGLVASGSIASGNVGWPHLASGAVRSGHLSTTGTPSASVFLRGDFVWASPTTISGSVASGVVGSGAIQGFFGSTRNIASGTVGVSDLGSGAVIAGSVGSGAIVSGNIASGQVGFGHIGNAAVRSGSVASGALLTYHMASGATATRAQFTGPFVSGTAWTATTDEIISGVRAVQVSPSGQLRIAMASVSGRMPAIGVIFDNVASGIVANVYTGGVFTNPASGSFDFSGYVGQLFFVGRSGQVVTASGAFNSGGLLSGDIHQPLGIVQNSGAGILNVAAMLPFVPGLITSGNIASGAVGGPHLNINGFLGQSGISVTFAGGQIVIGRNT